MTKEQFMSVYVPAFLARTGERISGSVGDRYWKDIDLLSETNPNRDVASAIVFANNYWGVLVSQYPEICDK